MRPRRAPEAARAGPHHGSAGPGAAAWTRFCARTVTGARVPLATVLAASGGATYGAWYLRDEKKQHLRDLESAETDVTGTAERRARTDVRIAMRKTTKKGPAHYH